MLNVVVFFLCFCVTLLSGGFFKDIPCVAPEVPKCVSIKQCPFFEDMLKSPLSRSAVRVIKDRQCKFIDDIPYVLCCERRTLPPVTTEFMTPSPLPIFDKHVDFKEHRNVNLLPNNICGHIMTDSRITYGTKTKINEYPWMALIVYDTDDGVDFKCGGTLINERYVLTAAHCTLETVLVGVRLGEHDMETEEDCDPEEHFCAPPPQDIYVENVKIHQEYNPKTYANDIALIRLSKPANFNFSNVQPICLPMEDMDLIGKFAVVTGWGVTENGRRSSQLQKVSLPVLPISKCQWNYRKFAPVTTKQICAGGTNGKDSCGGDSGGPLMYVGSINGSPRFVQQGLVSYGPRNCGSDGQPAIYTRVSKYIEWILDNLKP